MYSAYLEEHIQLELTKAIREATIQNPKDAVDFIGSYLLKIVEDDAKSKQQEIINATWAEEDKELEIKLKEKEAMIEKVKAELEEKRLKEEEEERRLKEEEEKRLKEEEAKKAEAEEENADDTVNED
eukprot:CAMPEP_0201580364 /NCGR_PEP_ID=MMETSP0190_2-20130828/43682_1 /ASSEMBLY_ACC=CAM_ASM_000263 /TAXON_ID=37353 /ORGANISM="Rosalina sp." /LENGTH=126 /DNA_ID=CAMNT_0048016267 /DNA_START=21 /DNA_END=401 /DNA_ORIENTATION=-